MNRKEGRSKKKSIFQVLYFTRKQREKTKEGTYKERIRNKQIISDYTHNSYLREKDGDDWRGIRKLVTC